jgi:lysophospholipid acyltransferase 1/2
MIFSMHIARYKFYFAWKLGECSQILSGLGYDFDTHQWNAIDNMDIVRFEFATSLKVALDAWNKRTSVWLRYIAYTRLPNWIRTPGTYILSAFWHGFYPGYYVCFLSAAIGTILARQVRSAARPAFQRTRARALFYDVVTWATTMLFVGFVATPFMLLNGRACFVFLFRSMYGIFPAALFTLAVFLQLYTVFLRPRHSKPKSASAPHVD